MRRCEYGSEWGTKRAADREKNGDPQHSPPFAFPKPDDRLCLLTPRSLLFPVKLMQRPELCVIRAHSLTLFLVSGVPLSEWAVDASVIAALPSPRLFPVYYLPKVPMAKVFRLADKLPPLERPSSR